MATEHRDALARAALGLLPKLLTLQDRIPHSPTYGCFDRNHWQYKIQDFPSGMSQEFAWPLTLAWALDIPGNPYFGNPQVAAWAEAGIDFAMRAAHPDGACDDYFPYERAAGAAAFSLLACVEAHRLLGLDRPDLVAFYVRRARWLGDHRESGRLANHEGLIALGLDRAAALTGDAGLATAARNRLDRLLSWQTKEGWFQEYEGCDPGYTSLTIGSLAQLHAAHPDWGLEAPIRRAVDCLRLFVHPDGSFGGEYASRNTLNFFPHGFEMVGRWYPPALAVNDRVLDALARGQAACFTDDHIVGHHCWSWLLAWRDYVETRPAPEVEPEGRHHLPLAGLLVERRGDTALIAALGKGGVFKLFRAGRLVVSDTQLSVRMRDGRVAVAQAIDDHAIEIGADTVTISGTLGWAKQAQMTPARLILLRLIMLTVGRFAADPVRRLLQRLLITGKRPAPFRFRRTLRWQGDRLVVSDALTGDGWGGVEAVGIGTSQTAIHVVMSRVFHPHQLEAGWQDLTPRLAGLAAGGSLSLEREY